MKLVEITNYAFNQVHIHWHGPYPWPKESGGLKNGNPPAAAEEDPFAKNGIYRAETSANDGKIIKYIGSTFGTFRGRLSKQHRIYEEIVPGQRKVDVYLGVLRPERNLRLERRHYKEIEYILQNVHYEHLISWHGLGSLPKTSRGEAWRITNHGQRGGLSRVVAYPAFAVAGRDR